MQIKMLSSMPVTIDGVHTVDAAAGDELVVGDGVGADLIAAGHASSLDIELERKDAGDADENKDSGSAAESKAKPRKKRRA